MNRSHLVSSAVVLFLVAGTCVAQTVTTTTTTVTSPTAAPPSIPDGRVIILPTTPRVPAAWRIVRVSSVDCTLTIDDQLATTLLEVAVTNQSGAAQEAELLLPIPAGSTVRSFQYDGTGPEPTARVLPKDEARRIYNSIVHSQKDPGLLEFAGQALIRTSAFPIPAGATQKIRITVEQLLSADNARLDYVLPKSDALATETSVPWTIKGTIKSPREITTVFSPSHDLVSERKSKAEVAFTVPARSASSTGSFRLSWQTPTSLAEPSGMLYAYPDSTIQGGKGGYFLFVASIPSERPEGTKPPLRDVQIVIDRSGSMRGEKIQQAKKAALNVLQGLADGERFNIIDYSDTVQSFHPVTVARNADTAAKAAAYINAIEANGGTNIGDALAEAFKAPIATDKPNVMPLVLFLTDGLPTVGERREGALREAAKAANTMQRRVFTFGVGYDVNAPLLTGLAKQTRAAATFVLPDEDVELKVSQVYRRLSGPVLGLPRLQPGGPVDGSPLWRDQLPAELPDLFEGDQLVVVGQYTGFSQDLRIILEGDGFGAKRNYSFNFKLDQASPRHGFVGRLWATRKVASLVEGLRLQSADGNLPPANDTKFKEIVDEIVRLSTRWGVLTEYTSFLALEPGAELTMLDGSTSPAPSTAGGIRVLAEQQLRGGAAAPRRTGGAGVAQDQDTKSKGESNNAQTANTYYRYATDNLGGSGKRVDVQQNLSVQNINSQSYFKRANRWVDGRLIDKPDTAPDTTVTLGSAAFDALADQLDAEGQTGVLALEGELLVLVAGKTYLIKP